MRSMGSRWYVYRPWTDERRQAASIEQRRRLGIPDGHARVYGHHIPFEHVEPLRYWAERIAERKGRKAAEAFVAEHVASNYRDAPFLRRQWLLKREAADVRRLISAIQDTVCYARN